MAIYDIQMCCFAKYTKNQIIQKADIIREEFINKNINTPIRGCKKVIFGHGLTRYL